MIRTLIIFIWIVFATFFLGIVAIISSFFSQKGNFPHIIARFWGKSILWVSRIKVTVKGVHNIDPAKSYIFMPNHQSNFDIPVLLGCLPAQFRWLAKAELFRIPLFGRAMRGCGYISIDRSNRKSAFRSLEKAADTIRNGVSVLIFPEGTRSLDGKIRSFKKGGFVLTVDSGVSIIPVIIHGTWSIMPKNTLRIMPGNVILEVLQPIETSEYTRKTKDDLMDKVKDIMCHSFYEGKKEK
ncbi:MAG: lysophospholipid acyltransferase family protein [Thermodesulfobacteriota bacterium]|nr:lysophospholipid acyltransferase family protein [Thermodesulfobacteriota bacterium]